MFYISMISILNKLKEINGENFFLSILDVGHGNCAILHDNNNIIVIDAGPGTSLLEPKLSDS